MRSSYASVHISVRAEEEGSGRTYGGDVLGGLVLGARDVVLRDLLRLLLVALVLLQRRPLRDGALLLLDRERAEPAAHRQLPRTTTITTA